MTDRDKALADIKRAKDFIVSYGISGALSDDVPSIEIAMVEMTLRELIDKALTPQSSADLGMVLRERVEGMRKVDCSTAMQQARSDGHNAAIDSVLRTIDEVIGRVSDEAKQPE